MRRTRVSGKSNCEATALNVLVRPSIRRTIIRIAHCDSQSLFSVFGRTDVLLLPSTGWLAGVRNNTREWSVDLDWGRLEREITIYLKTVVFLNY